MHIAVNATRPNIDQMHRGIYLISSLVHLLHDIEHHIHLSTGVYKLKNTCELHVHDALHRHILAT